MAGDEKRFRVWLWALDGVPHFGESFDTYVLAMSYAKRMKELGWNKATIYDGARQQSENPPKHQA